MTRATPAPASSILPNSPQAWLLAARLKTLPTAAAPVFVGTGVALSQGGADPVAAGAALVGALTLQIGCNFVNDAADHARGADGDDRLGAPRAAHQGWLSGRQLWRAAAVAFALATVCGAWLAASAGWPVIIAGTLAVGAAISYTAGPYPLGYLGLGEVLVFVFYGVVAVCGTALVQLGSVPPQAVWAAVPIGATAAAVLVVNNLRDRHQDAHVGKRTLAVRLGGQATRALYALLIATTVLVPVAVTWSGAAGAGWLLALLALPLVAAPLVRVLRADGAALEPALGATARFLAAYGVCLGIGVTL